MKLKFHRRQSELYCIHTINLIVFTQVNIHSHWCITSLQPLLLLPYFIDQLRINYST